MNQMTETEGMICQTVQTELLAVLRKRRYRVEPIEGNHVFRPATDWLDDQYSGIKVNCRMMDCRVDIQCAYYNDQPCVVGLWRNQQHDPVVVELHDEDWCSKFVTALDAAMWVEYQRRIMQNWPGWVGLWGCLSVIIFAAMIGELATAASILIGSLIGVSVVYSATTLFDDLRR